MKKNMTLNEKIAERIKELRKDRNLNQIEIAEILKIDKSTIAKYETGVSVPSVQMLVTLAKFFDVTTDYILGLED
jgi:transcriptional regulator with XRE-family HTH domain